MNLVINTSSDLLKILLFDKNKIFSKNIEEKIKTLQNLLPQIDYVLNLSNTNLRDITKFFVVIGPGSFTGLRIGVATVKAFLSVFKNPKIFGINMLDFLAWKIKSPFKSNYAILIKSTSTKYYVGFYDKNGIMIEQNHISKDLLINYEKNYNLYSYNCECENAKPIDFQDNDLINYCNFLLGQKNISENDLKPIYLALSQAEEELCKKQSKS